MTKTKDLLSFLSKTSHFKIAIIKYDLIEKVISKSLFFTYINCLLVKYS